MKDKLINYVYSQFEYKNGLSLPKDELTTKRIRDACILALEELQDHNETEINLPFIMADDKGPKHLNITITQEILKMVEIGYEHPFDQTLQNHGTVTHSSSNIDDIMSSSVKVDNNTNKKASLLLWVSIALCIAIGALAFIYFKNSH
jgi:hypothetical protein